MTRIDAHQHFWTYDPALYPWIDDDMAPLARDFMPGDLKPWLDKLGIDGTIVVQARQDTAETEWLLELSELCPWILAVVGWVDLRAADLEQSLRRLAGTKVRGVRHALQDEPPELMLRTAFRDGIAQLADFDLAYDLSVYPEHLANALVLAEQNPAQRFVLDHAAKPRIRDGQLSPWSDDIRRLAKADNVWCKVSGLVTEATWRQWEVDDFRVYLDVVFEAFGADRLLFGSDWPVCQLSANYGEVHDIVAEYANHLSAEPRAGLFGGNAVVCYGLAGS
jgi:L-fuconolactonase